MLVATSSSFALIIMLVMVPKERFMRGGAVMMRACGSANLRRNRGLPLTTWSGRRLPVVQPQQERETHGRVGKQAAWPSKHSMLKICVPKTTFHAMIWTGFGENGRGS